MNNLPVVKRPSVWTIWANMVIFTISLIMFFGVERTSFWIITMACGVFGIGWDIFLNSVIDKLVREGRVIVQSKDKRSEL